MRKFILVLTGVVFFASSVMAATNNFSMKKEKVAAVEIQKPLTNFTVGERLRFDVSWMGAHVGFGEIHILEKVELRGRAAYHVVAVAETNEFLSKIYPVRDELHSWIDVQTFHSLKFRKILSEGRYRADEETEFFPEAKKAVYFSHKNKTRKEFAIPGNVHDVVSAFYWFRLQEARVGQGVHAQVSSEEKTWDLDVQVLSAQIKEIRSLGSLATFCVEPKTKLKGVFYSRGRVWVYFTADSRRTPVWIQFKTPFGPVNGVLSKTR